MGGRVGPTGARLMAAQLDPQALAMRVEDYAAEWRARQASTERADRPRAAAAIRGLYAEAGMPAPRILWVDSPSAGALAYHLAQFDHAPVLGTHVRGDIGTGANQEWNALAEPFDLPPAWLRVLRHRITELLPARFAQRLLDGELFDAGPRMRAILEQHLAANPLAATPDDFAGRPVTTSLGRSLLGTGWDRYAATLGRNLAASLVQRAVAQAASSLLDLRSEDRRDRRFRPTTRLETALQAMQPGQFDAIWPTYGAFLDVLPAPAWSRRVARDRGARIRRRLALVESAGPWWALDGLAIVSERPLIASLDPRSRLHSESGPAIAWTDGTAIWAWHGVAVPEAVVAKPHRITIDAIRAEPNVEVRRVMIERLGWERIVEEGGAQLVHVDATGKLWELSRTTDWSWDRARFVEVVNSTPEPDGSRHHYFIRVPPEMQTAKQAVAWTFDLGEVEYRPGIET